MGAAMGLKLAMFFTFHGLSLLLKKLDLRLSALGNPAMKKPIMGGHMAMPNLVVVLPGVEAAASKMMANRTNKKGIASIDAPLSMFMLAQGVTE